MGNKMSDDRRVESQQQMGRIEADLRRLAENYDIISGKVDDLVETKIEIYGAMKFMKIMAGVIAAGAAIWAWIVSNISGLSK